MKRNLMPVCLIAIALIAITAPITSAQDGARPKRSQASAGKDQPHPPAVGSEAADFELKTLDDQTVSLRKLTADSPVVVLVLRGWPGYQCPICTRQVGEFLSKKADFEKLGAKVVMIYPGPKDLLNDHAKEFQAGKVLPEGFIYVTDPDYKFTNAWGLRWDANGETAYPSTFIIGKDNTVKFAATSTSHGGRTAAAAVLEELGKLK